MRALSEKAGVKRKASALSPAPWKELGYAWQLPGERRREVVFGIACTTLMRAGRRARSREVRRDVIVGFDFVCFEEGRTDAKEFLER